MDENGEINAESAAAISDAAVPVDEGIDVTSMLAKPDDMMSDPFADGQIRTLNGDICDDVFAADAINYQILLGKIETLLDRLHLDA